MKVKDRMIPISDCPAVSQERNAFDAIHMLDAFRQRFERWEYRPRLLLVRDRDLEVVGYIRHHDLLRAFCPLNPEGEYAAPDLATLSQTARKVKTGQVMRPFTDADRIDQEALLGQAMAKLAQGSSQALLVTSGDTAVGILRLSDVFGILCKDVLRNGRA